MDERHLRGVRRRNVRYCRTVKDVNLDEETIYVLGKGQNEKERLSIPSQTKQAIANWLDIRGLEPGPLFFNLDRSNKERVRLKPNGLYKVTRKLGSNLGLKTNPHSFRHSAITAGFNAGRSAREMQDFSRHKSLDTLMIYDHKSKNLGLEVARVIASQV